MKLFIALSTVALASSVAFAQPKSTSDEAEIRRVSQEYFRAFNALDTKTLERVLTDKAIFSNGGRETYPKATMLTAIAEILRKAGRNVAPIAHTNIFRVTLHGNSAVMIGRSWQPSKQNGGEKTIFTHIFTRQNNQWRIAELISQTETP